MVKRLSHCVETDLEVLHIFFFHKARSHGLEDVPQEVATLISHATQERLRNVLEKLATIAEHRLEIYKVTCVVLSSFLFAFDYSVWSLFRN